MSRSVLIVDDDRAFLSLAARILTQAGLEVVATAEDAAGAVSAADDTKPDCALVDLGLPDRDGVDLAYEGRVDLDRQRRRPWAQRLRRPPETSVHREGGSRERPAGEPPGGLVEPIARPAREGE
jgi:CheY-like chemotaxis protein